MAILEYFSGSKELEDEILELKGELLKKDWKLKDREQQVAQLRAELSGLKARVEQYGPRPRDLVKYLSPVPEGETGRREYVAQVAGFFEGGLRDKLNYMHQQFRNQVGMFPLTERETDFFRACINVVGLMLDWGEECTNEHRSNIASAHHKGEDSAFDASSETDELREQ